MNQHPAPQTSIIIRNARTHNLKGISLEIPRDRLVVFTGVSGSGKSSLVFDTLYTEAQRQLIDTFSSFARSRLPKLSKPPVDEIRNLATAIVIDHPDHRVGGWNWREMMQLDLFDPDKRIADYSEEEYRRLLYTEPVPVEKKHGAGTYMKNFEGACPKCRGLGTIAYEMHFMDEVKVTCDECSGKRYTDEVLALRYGGKDIYEILTTTIDGLNGFFQSPKIKHKLKVLSDVGLGYLEIGQPLSTLSGGEAQRIKLASELHKKGNIYVMDEPSTGLHMADIERLMKIIRNLADHENTVIVIEHNPDIIRRADWIIDLGPEGGSEGGEVLFEGTPEDMVKCHRSYTGSYL